MEPIPEEILVGFEMQDMLAALAHAVSWEVETFSQFHSKSAQFSIVFFDVFWGAFILCDVWRLN